MAPGCLLDLSAVLTKPWAGACVPMSPHRSCLFQESGGPQEEQDQGVERESEEGAGVIPSSPEEWLESPKEEDSGLSPGERVQGAPLRGAQTT